MKYYIYTYFLLAIFLVSCGQVETYTFSTGDVEITATGPLFEGANTATGDYTIDLSVFLEEHGAEIGDISEAKLKSAQLTILDSLNFNFVDGISLLIAGDVADMQNVGVLNPVPDDQTQVNVQVAEEQSNIDAFFKESMMTYVIDFNITQDTFIDIRMIGNFEFDISLKQ